MSWFTCILLMSLGLILYPGTRLFAIHEADSIKALLDVETDQKNRGILLFKLANRLRTNDKESAMKYVNQALEIGQKLDDPWILGKSYNIKGLIYHFSGRYDTALVYLQKAESLAKEHELDELLASVFNHLGLVYMVQDYSEKALPYFLESARREKELNNPLELANALNNIGKLFYETGKPDKAYNYYKQALEVYDSIGHKPGLSIAYNNIGIIHSKKKEYNKALDYYERSLAIDIELGEKNISINLNNIGSVWYHKGNLIKAIEYYSKVLAIRKELGNPMNLAEIYYNLGECYRDIGENYIALTHYKKSLENSRDLGMITVKKLTHESLSSIFEKMGKSEESLYHQKQFNIVSDSLSKKQNREKLIEMQSEYEIEKRELEITKKKLQIQKDKAERNMIIFGSLFIIATLGLSLWVFALKRKAEKAESERIIAKHVAEIDYLRASISTRIDDKPVTELKVSVHRQELNHYLISPLTERELEVLNHVSNGRTNQEVADELFISLATVKTHINHIYDKLDVSNRTQAVVKAGRLEILEQTG